MEDFDIRQKQVQLTQMITRCLHFTTKILIQKILYILEAHWLGYIHILFSNPCFYN